MKKIPRVGVGVFIVNDNKILLAKRKGSHGAGTWSIPGGALDWAESLEDCARREVLEETGLHIANLRQGPYVNSVFQNEDKHCVSIFMIADYAGGVPLIMEPEKSESWHWFSWNELPSPLFLPALQLLEQLSYAQVTLESLLAAQDYLLPKQ